jgi:hypothetical protein
MTSFGVITCMKAILVFKEDSMQIPTQKSQILYFHPDGPVKRPDAH